MSEFASDYPVLSVAPSARGFGYCVMEGGAIVAYGNKVICGKKNAKILKEVGRMILKYRPDALVRKDVTARQAHRKQIQRRRVELGLTQEQFAARCQLHGFDVSRATISQIEAHLRCVIDTELWLLADALGLRVGDLFPPKMARKSKPKGH